MPYVFTRRERFQFLLWSWRDVFRAGYYLWLKQDIEQAGAAGLNSVAWAEKVSLKEEG